MSSSVFIVALLVVIVVAVVAVWLWGALQARLAHGASAEQLGRMSHELETERQRVAQLNVELEAIRQQADSDEQRHDESRGALEGELARVVAQRADCAGALAVAQEQAASLRGRLEETMRERDQVRLAAEQQVAQATQAAQLAEGLREKCEALLQRFDAEKLRADKWENACAAERDRVVELSERLAEARKGIEAGEEKLEFLARAKQELTVQFKAVAGELMQQSGQQQTAQQQEKLIATLAPFKETLAGFTKKVDETERARIAEQGKLGNQLEQLMKASTQLDKGAQDLTRALKGDNKVAGGWGEFVLTRVLEVAGLQEGREFVVQESRRDAEGHLLRPDVVVRLPEEKSLVIDSKVSLKTWADLTTEGSLEGDWASVAASVRTHMQQLSKKNYEQLYGLKGVDFVLMFIPVEPVFLEIARREPALLQEAWERRVMLVGPSTLQWALRPVASVWRFERQNQHAHQIADHAARLYDKFVSFIEELEKVGRNLNRANEAYTHAVGQLRTGRGNIVRQVTQLKDMGITPKKSLPSEWVEASLVEMPALLAAGDALVDISVAQADLPFRQL